MITYEQQWQKITSAYLNNQLQPQNDCACFIGNLLNNIGGWSFCRRPINSNFRSSNVTLAPSDFDKETVDYALEVIKHESRGLYSVDDIIRMEQNFLRVANKNLRSYYNEDNLFLAMTSTLEILRQIHLEKGDETAKEITLTKRILQTV